MHKFVDEIQAYFDRLKRTIDSIDVNQINILMNLLIDALQDERQIFIMGNGGSAATASHFVCDFNKGLSWGKQKRFKFICLNDNVPTMMAYANDTSYDDVFVEPLKNYFHPDDLIIGISGSGNSRNVLNAVNWANKNGGVTIGLTGYTGGKLKEQAMYNVHIPIEDMQITEDLHMVLDHCMMKILYDVV
jgi:D-sedoheptulose 7-phosphate isomerase